MEKEFVPYELAVKLKELGFDEPCFGGWDNGNKWYYHPDSDIMVDAPLWQQAFDWFREKGYYINIQNEEHFTSFKRVNPKMEILSFVRKSDIENHYEEARLECLKKLIEIVENEKNSNII